MTERDRIDQVLADAGIGATERAWMVPSCPTVVHAERYVANRPTPATVPTPRVQRHRGPSRTPLAKLVREVDERRERTERAIANARRVPFSPITEGRVLATLLVCEWALSASPELEVEDFADPRHVALFAAMRACEARGEFVGVIEVLDEIERLDRRDGSHMSEHVHACFVGILVVTHPPYSEHEWPHNLWWLRELAQVRRSL